MWVKIRDLLVLILLARCAASSLSLLAQIDIRSSI